MRSAIVMALCRQVRLAALGAALGSLIAVAAPAQSIFALQRSELFAGACVPPATLHERPFYTLCFLPGQKSPLWSAFELNAQLLKGTAERTEDFRHDPDLPASNRAVLADYQGTGFDRGHMAEAEAFKRNHDTMSSTFLLSNMAPQRPTLNRGRWRSLEADVRAWAASVDRALIFTGSLYLDENEQPVPPENFTSTGLAIPTHSFKAVLREKDGEVETIGFLLPNRRKKNPGPNSRWAVSTDRIEALLGQDLFAFLDDAIEARAEATFITPEVFE